MPFCMITFGHDEHVSAPARHFFHDHLWPPMITFAA